MAAIPPVEWGRRLSDRIRAALEAGDLASARRLALEGDGQARSLEKEYTLMYKGLGITVRILLDLLGATAARHRARDQDPASQTLTELLLRLRREMIALLRQAYTEPGVRQAIPDTPGLLAPSAEGGLGGDLARTVRLLDEAESLFSREQARLAHEVVRAVEAGDAARARALVDEKERGQYVPLHDRLIRFMAEVFAYVLEQFGPGELYRFHRGTAEGQRQGFEKWDRLTPAEFAQATAFLLKQHMGELEVREDDAKFTIVQTPCGSGGRLRLAGAYSGPRALAFVEERGPLTLGGKEFPVYCSHCPIWNSVAPIEWFGRPHWVFENPARPDGSCTLHIYKHRDLVPAAYVRQLGQAEPER
ncbi:MAG: hypothetical protein HY724_03710 [Candidatus Rokubacteria bacterium]|nr:hypothetical protein [Candidatus Rokubacteria bacterium]